MKGNTMGKYSSLEDVRKNPTLFKRMQEIFQEKIRVELHGQLEQHKARASVAQAKIAVLKEEQRLIELRGETHLLESRLKEQRKQVRGDGTPRPTQPSPQQVTNAYSRLTFKP
jgi:outer membrane protein TolC